jgi:acyl transferase domain-containing protein/SAM-dependent methyltransferase
MFTGQGSQYGGMGRELFKRQPVFRRELQKCAEILGPLLDRPVLDLLFGEKNAEHSLQLLDNTQYAQPALFALEFALAEMWRSWGVQPAAVLGHSIGEYVAACVAGVFSLEDGLRLIAERGRLMATLSAGGSMATVFAEESRVAKAIAGTATTIACLNGPTQIVISGEAVAVSAVLDRLTEEGIRSRRLVVSHGFHSSLMDPILDPFQQAAERVQYSEPLIAILSNVTGRFASPGLMSCSAYWRRHLRNPVLFGDSIRTLHQSGKSVFLEIGPHPALTAIARMSIPEIEVVWAASLVRDAKDWESLLESVSKLYVRGVNLEWAGLHAMHSPKRVVLPTYPFQRRRYWLEQRAPTKSAMAIRSMEDDLTTHPFLGKRLDSPAISGTVFEIEMGDERPAFLDDHRIFGHLIMPSPAYIEMALAGASKISQQNRTESIPCEVTDLVIRAPLFLPEEGSCLVQLIYGESTEQGIDFRVCSRETPAAVGNPWQAHVSGRVRIGIISPGPEEPHWERDEVWKRCSVEIDARSYYDSLIRLGLDFGDRFRGIVRIRRRDGEAIAETRLPESLRDGTSPYLIHPALLDSCFHLLGATLPLGTIDSAYLLVGLERFTLFALPPERFWNHTVMRPVSGSEVFSGDICLYDDEGRMVAEIVGLHLKRATGEAMARITDPGSPSLFYKIAWREQELSSAKEKEDGTALAADFIPSPFLLAEKAREELGQLAISEDLGAYGQLIPKLEALSAAYIQRALIRMGWSPLAGECSTTRALEEQLSVLPAHRRLFERLIGILVEEDILQPEADGWIVLKRLEPLTRNLQSEAEALKQQFPACSAEVTLLARCAEQLDEVLRGTCDPLQLLFPGGDFATADALYRNSPFARACNSVLRRVVFRAMENAPKDRLIRILEIGAGTGGTTSFLLPDLPPGRTRFTFSDVSPFFLTRARDEFRNYSFARYELLDIEKPPAEQGFHEQSFDVIIAANVLHATRDLRETLANAASLLAPGGLLILLEGTGRQRWVDLTFGLTGGWWRFTDTVLRPDYALISAAQWESLLRETGLEAEHCATSPSGIGVLPQSVIIGKRPLAMKESNEVPMSPGFWVILGDETGIAEEVARLISQQGEECIRVSKGTEYEFVERGRGTLNPLHAEDFARLFTDALMDGKGPVRGVLDLWPVDEEIAGETTPSQWRSAQGRLGGGVLHATRAFLSLPSANISREARLWFVTRGAQAVLGEANSAAESCQPAQALVWGLARVISLEHPGRFGAVIDLDSATTSQESATAIWREIESASGEDAMAFRNARRLLPRVVRTTQPPLDPLILREDASYVITGGLGGLGLQIADWMAARNAGHIVLLSRRRFPERQLWDSLTVEDSNYEAVRKILDAEKLGARITVAQCDVADELEMGSLFKRFGKEDPPLRGIIHGAVEMTSCAIRDLDLELFQRMCHAKALGGWILHQLTLQADLDFFVLFSSTTALWGVAGLGHYAAANQALDLLAEWRRKRGLRALSVNWGTWQEMRVASAADKERFVQAGLHAMPGAQALGALERLVGADRTSAVVASVDWHALRSAYEARRARPLFAEVQSRSRTGKETNTSSKSANANSEVRRQLQNAAPSRRRDLLIAHLRSLAGNVLGFDSSREIDLEQGLFDMGMDSLMAVELKGQMERSLGLPLPSTLTFNYPTIKALADYLLGDALVFDVGQTPEKTAQIPFPGKVVSLETPSEELSEEDLSFLLLKKLEQLE